MPTSAAVAYCLLPAVVVSLMAAACGGGPSERDDGSGQPSGTIRVLAAASLTDAFEEITTAFEDEFDGASIELQLAGSSTLREQVLEGVPADVFASANESNMETVAEAGEISGQPVIFARNRLTMAVPSGNPGEVESLADLADPGLLVGLCAAGVPCGDLAREALAAAGVEPSLDTNERDVRALLGRIAADELDVGIVYVTDVAVGGEDVEAIALPATVTAEAVYPIAILDDAPNPTGAESFVEFVLGPTARTILAAHGFGA